MRGKRNVSLADLQDRAPKVVTDLLQHLESYKLPQHDGAIHRAKEWLQAVERRKRVDINHGRKFLKR